MSLENKTESWNGIELREFQRRVRDSNAPFVILDAPTGAGKTLAILSAFLRSGSKYGMLVYPTNELILDQAEGISKLLSKMRINATILTPFTSLATPAGVAVIGATTSDMLVAVVTGE
ncbi:MAG: DEAD/DEAH box helicase, partial [Thermoplasmata archaeon]